MYFTITTEVQIVLAICLFYLYDAALGLQSDEGLLLHGRRWRAILATQGFELRKVWLVWPSVVLPHRAVYRMRWSNTCIDLPGQYSASQAGALAEHATSFKPFAIPLYALAMLLFVALPLALFVLHSEVVLLVLAALIYLCTLCIAFLALRHGRKGHTDAKTARAIALQIMLCPPFALNTVQKLSLTYAPEPGSDLLQASKQLMSAQLWAELSQRVQHLMTTEMQEIAELPEYAQQLEKMQTALSALKAADK